MLSFPVILKFVNSYQPYIRKHEVLNIAACMICTSSTRETCIRNEGSSTSRDQCVVEWCAFRVGCEMYTSTTSISTSTRTRTPSVIRTDNIFTVYSMPGNMSQAALCLTRLQDTRRGSDWAWTSVRVYELNFAGGSEPIWDKEVNREHDAQRQVYLVRWHGNPNTSAVTKKCRIYKPSKP